MGVRAAQHRRVGHPGELDVIDVVALARDEAGILFALDRSAEDFGCHRLSSFSARQGRVLAAVEAAEPAVVPAFERAAAPAALGAVAPARMALAASRMATTMLW